MLVTCTISTVKWCLGRAKDIYIYTYIHTYIYHVLLGRQLRGIITLLKVMIGRICSNWNVTGLGAWSKPYKETYMKISHCFRCLELGETFWFTWMKGHGTLTCHDRNCSNRKHNLMRAVAYVFLLFEGFRDDRELIFCWWDVCFMSHWKDYRRIETFHLSPHSHFL